MRFPSPFLWQALLVAGLFTLPALAQDQLTLGFEGAAVVDGLPAPWKFERWSPMVGFGDYTAKASVVAASGAGAPGGKVLQLECHEAGFIVGSERSIDVNSQRWASWAWRADTLPTGASFRARDTNDQALQLLFGFEDGKILGYIWDSTGSPGATGSGLSWREDVRVMVLQAGPAKLGQWVEQRRDLVADYQALFGEAPGQLVGVALQSNCQHTESRGHGFVGPIRLAAD